jgi:hypothetical protein
LKEQPPALSSIFCLFNLDMPSDQQKMYEYAINMAQLLLSDLLEDDAIIQIEKLVVRKIIYLIAKTLFQSIQLDTVDIARKAVSQGICIHIPAILHSASVKFDTAFCPSGNQKPQIKHISENDMRGQSSSLVPTSSFSPSFWCAHNPLIHTIKS